MSQSNNIIYPLAMSYVTAKVMTIAANCKLDQYVSMDGSDINVLAGQFGFKSIVFKRFLRVLSSYNIVQIKENTVFATELTKQLADIRTPHIDYAYKVFDELEYTLVTGKPAWEKVFHQPFYNSLSGDQLEQFATWCQRSGEVWLECVYALYPFEQYTQIVDIAGGMGHFLAGMLNRFPKQHGVLFDQASIIKKAYKTFDKTNCRDRVSLVSGDFFETIPSGGDLYILARTLLNWNDEKAVDILNVCAENMPSSAKLLIIDFILPDINHPHYSRAAVSDLNLAAIIGSKHRTEVEWKEIIENSHLTLTNSIVSDYDVVPEPFCPLILLECIKDK